MTKLLLRSLVLLVVSSRLLSTFEASAAVGGTGRGGGAGSITNLPSYALTNNQSSQVTLKGGLTNNGALEGSGSAFFTGPVTSKTATARVVIQGTINAGLLISQGQNYIALDTGAGPAILSTNGIDDAFMFWNGSVFSLITSPTGTVAYGHFYTPSNSTAANYFATVDDAYGAGWNASLGIPTKNAVYDKIESLSLGTSPGGANTMLQMNYGGVLAGATNLTYDGTNGRLGLAIASARPNSTLEIGGTGALGTQIRAGGSSTGKTNLFDSDGVGQLGAAGLKIYIGGAATGYPWAFDVAPRFSLHPYQSNYADVGTWAEPVGTNWATWLLLKSGIAFQDSLLAPASNLTNYTLNAGQSEATVNLTNHARFTLLSGGVAGIKSFPCVSFTNFTASAWTLEFTNTWTALGTTTNSLAAGKVCKTCFEVDGARVWYWMAGNY